MMDGRRDIGPCALFYRKRKGGGCGKTDEDQEDVECDSPRFIDIPCILSVMTGPDPPIIGYLRNGN